VELPGQDHIPFVGDQESILEELRKFLKPVKETRQAEPVLATVLAAFFKSRREPSDPPSSGWQRFHEHVARELEWSGGRAAGERGHYLMASFDGPGRAIRCASAVAFYAARFGIQFTAGIHTGECEIPTGKLLGPAVETARQIEEHAGLGEILVSGTVRDLVAGSGIRFQPKGFLAADGFELELLRLVEREVAARAAAV